MSFLNVHVQTWVECLLFMSKVTVVIFFTTVIASFIIAILAVIFRSLPDELFQLFAVLGCLLMLSIILTISCYLAIKASK